MASAPTLDLQDHSSTLSENSRTSLRSWFSRSSASTDSSTIRTAFGPDRLAGRAIMAFGEATLRSVENIIIGRKFAAMAARIPVLAFGNESGADAVKEGDDAKMWDELLELTRAGLYSDRVRQEAFRLIMIQLHSKNIPKVMLNSFSRWPSTELELFLRDFLASPYHTSSASQSSTNTTAGVESVLSLLDSKAISFMYLLLSLGSQSLSNFHSLLSLGLLSIIFRICLAVDMRDRHSPFSDKSDFPSVLAACNTVLASYPSCKHLILEHPLYVFWPPSRPFFLREDRESRLPSPDWARQAAWKNAEEDYVGGRLNIIGIHLGPRYIRELSLLHLLDICVDLLAFSRDDAYSPVLQLQAIFLLHSLRNTPGLCQQAYGICARELEEQEPQPA